ncbi:MAG TPA: DUF1697 domain-containing protein [Ramlibacter sp.]|uniref:DUF1697 domain-containing protein n=1 Tax=Ramlibacter sp. TaxID=1917967 RepID=UPI002D8097A8|nr:DUF1697 domain-containing protein [Ramlibacter sp.]HET8744456.1 DUF1697 domain-containing protein [Ramlibacter sp.]
MPRHVAFLRGVSPMNLRMPALKACVEGAGFANVRTILSSGNVAFDSPGRSARELEQALEDAMARDLGRAFFTIVRSAQALAALVATDPFAGYGLPPQAKRVVSFLRAPRPPRVPLPLTLGTATVIRQQGADVLTAYLPGPDGPVFMKLIEQAFGADVTTRTWETLRKCAIA